MKGFVTKAERKKAVKILLVAKEKIGNHEEDAVCTAIRNHIYDEYQLFTERIGRRLRDNIREALGSNLFVTHWLIYDAGIKPNLVHEHAREYRLLWIDSMIRDLEEQGV